MGKASQYNKIQKQIDRETDRLTKERDARCVPLAHELLRAMASAQLPVEDLTHEKKMEHYAPVVKALIDMYLEHDILIADASYINKIVLQIVEETNNLLATSLAKSVERAEMHLWGDRLTDVSMGRLDTIIKQSAGDNPVSTSEELGSSTTEQPEPKQKSFWQKLFRK